MRLQFRHLYTGDYLYVNTETGCSGITNYKEGAIHGFYTGNICDEYVLRPFWWYRLKIKKEITLYSLKFSGRHCKFLVK